MSEITNTCREAQALRVRGMPFLLATVVRVQGSAYRRPGARMIVAEDRWLTGSLSGGCLERDILMRGAFRTRHGGAVLVTYDSTSDDEARFGLGIGCNGMVDVLLECIDGTTVLDPTRFFAECLDGESVGALATVFHSENGRCPAGARLAMRSGGLVGTTIADGSVRSRLLAEARAALEEQSPTALVVEAHGVEALVERICPPPHLFVVGTRHDAPPLASLARALGFGVTVADTKREAAMHAERAVIATAQDIGWQIDRKARAAAVLMTHDYERDRECLPVLLASRARYVGVLGPRARTERMLAERGLVLTPAQRSRLHAPVGLDLGAETPPEIAVAVLAEILATLSGGSATKLRDRVSIHAKRNSLAFESQLR